MIKQDARRGVLLQPKVSAQNQIDSPDGVSGLTIRQAGKAASQRPVRIFSGTESDPRIEFEGAGNFRFGSGAAASDTYVGRVTGGGLQIGVPANADIDLINGGEAVPRVRIDSAAKLQFGGGALAPDTSFERWGAKNLRTVDTALRIESVGDLSGGVSNPQVPLWVDRRGTDGAIMDGTLSSGTIRASMFRGRPVNGINGTRGDTPLSDNANVADHTSFNMIELRSLDTSPECRFDGRGSFHHVYSDVQLMPMATLTGLTGTASSNLVTKAAHGLVANDPIHFTALTGGAGLNVGQPYFVIASGLTANDFKVSASQGGAEIDITSNITAGTLERIPYAEALNFYGTIDTRRKGAFSSNVELRNVVASGSPARVAVARFIVEDANPIASYSAQNLGAGSRFIDSGAMAVEVLSQGPSRAGTGISIMGSSGWERALRVYNQAQVLVSGIDGEGGVFTRVKAGSLADGDFRLPTDGLLAINSTANDLEFRAGGVWRGLLDKAYSKQPVRVAATGNVNTASPGGTHDGVALSNGDRILLMFQTTEAQNGIYVFNGAASALTRARDADEGIEMRGGVEVSVDDGATYHDSKYMLVINGVPTIGTTALRFSDSKGAYVDPDTAPAGLRPLLPSGGKLENMPRYGVALSNQAAALVTGTIRVFPLGVARANEILSAINLLVGTTASTGVTNSWAGIARVSDRTILAISATSTATTAANTLKTFPFAAAYTPPSDVMIFGFVMYQATVPSLLGINQAQNVIVSNPVVNGNSGTGQTTPPAVGTALAALSADTEIPYSYLT